MKINECRVMNEKTKNFTCQQLADAALSKPTTELDPTDLNSLYNIFILLLKKIGCENENVVITGMPCKHLRKLMNRSSSLTKHFTEEDTDAVVGFDKLPEIEAKIRQLEFLMNQGDFLAFDLKAQNCTVEMVPEKATAFNCSLLRNCLFKGAMKQLIENIFNSKFDVIENKVKCLQNEFLRWQEHNETSGIQHLVNYMSQITDMFAKIHLSQEAFNRTLQEIQQIFNQKADKSEIIMLKETIRHIFNETFRRMESTVDGLERSRAVAFVVDKNRVARPSNSYATSKACSFNFTNYKCPCTLDPTLVAIPLEITLAQRIEKRLNDSKSDASKIRLTSINRLTSKNNSIYISGKSISQNQIQRFPNETALSDLRLLSRT